MSEAGKRSVRPRSGACSRVSLALSPRAAAGAGAVRVLWERRGRRHRLLLAPQNLPERDAGGLPYLAAENSGLLDLRALALVEELSAALCFSTLLAGSQ